MNGAELFEATLKIWWALAWRIAVYTLGSVLVFGLFFGFYMNNFVLGHGDAQAVFNSVLSTMASLRLLIILAASFFAVMALVKKGLRIPGYPFEKNQ